MSLEHYSCKQTKNEMLKIKIKNFDAWSGVRTHADKRPADLKSAPLDPSGIQANVSLEGLEPPIF